MKRVGYLYEKIIDVNNCKKAILNASKSKKKRSHVLEVLEDIDFYAEDLSNRLQNLDFTTPYRIKTIEDGLSHKKREIQVPNFYPDQCSHHAIVQIIMPIVIKSSYYWSCANIKGRGISRASKYMSRVVTRGKAKYCAKFDISKFYPSVSHDILKEKLKRKIKDDKALKLLFKVIDTYEGLPIGNYTSPLFAELYLQDLDYYIKQDLRISYYVRYADDLVLMDNNKRKLHSSINKIIEYAKKDSLQIKGNYQMFLVKNDSKGRKIDFIGRCYAIGYTTIRKRVSLAVMRHSRLIQKLQKDNKDISFKNACGFISRCAVFKHTNSYSMKKKYMYSIDINMLKDVIRKNT